MLAFLGGHWYLLNDDEAAVWVMFPELVEYVKEMFIKRVRMVKESILK